MENMDEKILKQREAMEEFEKQRFSKENIEKENKQSIFNGIVQIHKIPVKFSERLLLDGKIGIWMPEDFEPLSQEAINATYLLGNKPDIVYGNTYMNLTVGFHYTEHNVPNEYMGEFVKLARIIMERMGPKTHIYKQKAWKTGNHAVSGMELVSHTITDAVYNIIFFSSLRGRVLIGFMNFNYRFLDRYQAIVQEMLESFRFVGDVEEE